ncbi:hypothetical protein [uncultured Aquimarina sp.]|uniref:hypothetical protein n=1 Tax=uncultured Aquimarina sp. TaxID=575652 RepID=UPI002633825A|nr:hypothetical protein [uncultured Aquimarina sp.]
MDNNYIEFKKKRELGEILTDTFAFLRINFKSIFSVLAKTCLIPFILLLISFGYQAYAASSIFDSFDFYNSNIFSSGNILFSYLLVFITSAVFYSSFFGAIMILIKEYANNNGIISEQNVVTEFKEQFSKIIGLGIVGFIIVTLSFCLCILPVLYFFVPMNLIFSIMIFRNKGIGESISESFDIIKNEFWITFATYLIIMILLYIVSLVISIPIIIYTMFKTFTAATEGGMPDLSVFKDWWFILLNTILSGLQYFLIIIIAISSAFIYFNLNERKHHTGTLEQIDSLGKSE